MDTSSDPNEKVSPCKLDFSAKRRNLTSKRVGAGAFSRNGPNGW